MKKTGWPPSLVYSVRWADPTLWTRVFVTIGSQLAIVIGPTVYIYLNLICQNVAFKQDQATVVICDLRSWRRLGGKPKKKASWYSTRAKHRWSSGLETTLPKRNPTRCLDHAPMITLSSLHLHRPTITRFCLI